MSVESLRSTTPTPSRGNRFTGCGGAIVFGLVAAGLWSAGHPYLAIIAMLVTLLGVWMLVTGKGSDDALCPLCGKKIVEFSDKFVRCPWCFAYSERRDNRLWEVEQDRVEAKPTFLFPLPPSLRLPRLCCACGQLASASVSTTVNYSLQPNSAMQFVLVKHVSYTIGVPYCDRHKHATEFEAISFYSTPLDFRTKDEKGVAYQFPGLEVSSYRFYREFLQLNGIKSAWDPKLV
jgi:hypothetical protein